MMRGRPFRVPPAGLPNTDAVMERGVLLPLSHALSPEDLCFVTAQVAEFLSGRR